MCVVQANKRLCQCIDDDVVDDKSVALANKKIIYIFIEYAQNVYVKLTNKYGA